MSDTFTESASRLAGAAGWMLGWNPEEFWRATPAELAAVLGAAGESSGGAVTRYTVETLQERFPDG